jgi:catechol 2,3-dioxygenase-like lactoylglutathione lyase family enzyme
MLAKLTQPAIDLGIVVRDLSAAVGFYRDLLGFEDEGETPMPGGGRMRRLRCGESLIKLVEPGQPPAAQAPPGGPGGATGYRYFTICASNLDEIAAACERAGRRVPVPPLALRPGVRILMVEDPDGNWVEFAHYSDDQANG